MEVYIRSLNIVEAVNTGLCCFSVLAKWYILVLGV